MIINDPTIYFGKKIKVFSTSGRVTTGELYGYLGNLRTLTMMGMNSWSSMWRMKTVC